MQNQDDLEKNWEKAMRKIHGTKELNFLKKLKGKRIPIPEEMGRAFKEWYLKELSERERLGEEWQDNVSGLLEDVMLD